MIKPLSRSQPRSVIDLQWVKSRIRNSGNPESGQIMLLSIGFMVVALALIAVVVTATAIQLDRDRLWNTADDAARYAAGAIDQESFYQESRSALDGVPTTNDSVQRSVAEYLELAAPVQGDLKNMRLTHAESPDGRTAVVVLEGVSRPAMLGWFLSTFANSDGVAIRVESSARAW